jgi:2-C-methyl-D-erythritol 4-phosphate cytidylyltransferase
MSVHITKGDYRNIKITTEEDFAAADVFLTGRIEDE